MEEQTLVAVRMIRENLDQIPRFALPSPYTWRAYQPGDAATWIRIQQRTETYRTISPELFEKEFAQNQDSLRARQLFMCDADGAAIGTATAWFNQHYHGTLFGRVHWVAIVPPRQGKGLAKPLLAATCNRLRDLGHTRAYLVTETVRLPAIHLYLKFGFRPEIQDARDALAWRQVEEAGLDLTGEQQIRS